MPQLDALKSPSGLRTPRGKNDVQATMDTVPSFGSNFDNEEDQNHHVRKSVLARVKDKARKWRQTLAKKKHGHDAENVTPAWGVSLEEDEDDDDPEYHGAPMYESELAPDAYKALPEIATGKDSNKAVQEANPMTKTPTETATNTSTKTITETVTEMLTPAYSMVSEATQMITTKIQGPLLGNTETATGENTTGISEQIYDKGVSVKEYLMQKLEPGEEERALSRVISDAISPRKTGEDMGVVEKVKGAVSSLLSVSPEVPASPSPSAMPATATQSAMPVTAAPSVAASATQSAKPVSAAPSLAPISTTRFVSTAPSASAAQSVASPMLATRSVSAASSAVPGSVTRSTSAARSAVPGRAISPAVPVSINTARADDVQEIKGRRLQMN